MTPCAALLGRDIAELEPGVLPKLLPPLAKTPVVTTPYPAAVLYSGNTGPALAFKEVAQSAFVTANFDMEKASLAARMDNLASVTKKHCKSAVNGVGRITGGL